MQYAEKHSSDGWTDCNVLSGIIWEVPQKRKTEIICVASELTAFMLGVMCHRVLLAWQLYNLYICSDNSNGKTTTRIHHIATMQGTTAKHGMMSNMQRHNRRLIISPDRVSNTVQRKTSRNSRFLKTRRKNNRTTIGVKFNQLKPQTWLH